MKIFYKHQNRHGTTVTSIISLRDSLAQSHVGKFLMKPLGSMYTY